MKNFASRATWKFFAVFFVGVALVGGLYLHGMEQEEKQIDKDTEIYFTFKMQDASEFLMHPISQKAFGLSGLFRDIFEGKEKLKEEGAPGENTFYDEDNNIIFISLNTFLDEVDWSDDLDLKNIKGFIDVWNDFAQSKDELPDLSRLDKELLSAYVALADLLKVTEQDAQRETSLLDFLAGEFAEKIKKQIAKLKEEDFEKFLTGADQGNLLDKIEDFGGAVAQLLGEKLFEQEKDIKLVYKGGLTSPVKKLFALDSGGFVVFSRFRELWGYDIASMKGIINARDQNFEGYAITGASIAPDGEALILFIPRRASEQLKGNRHLFVFDASIKNGVAVWGFSNGRYRDYRAYKMLREGKFFLGKNNKLEIYDINELKARKEIRIYGDSISNLTVFPEQKELGFFDFGERIFRIFDFNLNYKGKLNLPKRKGAAWKVSAVVAFSRGRLAFLETVFLDEGTDTELYIDDRSRKAAELVWKEPKDSAIQALVALPDENHLAFVCKNGKMKIFNIHKKEVVLDKDLDCGESKDPKTDLVFVPGGWLVSSCDKNIQIWDVYPFLDLYKKLTFEQAVLVKYLQLKRRLATIPEKVKNNERFKQIYERLPEKTKLVIKNLNRVLSY